MKAWQDLVGGESLTRAEVALIETCLAGEAITFGDGSCPKGPLRIHEIRAPILKALITGGLPDQPTTDIGLGLQGAYISGLLNLSLCRAKGLTGLINCRFEHGLEAMQAQFEFLNLSGSYLPKLNAQGARVAGSVFLKDGFHATGEVNLSGAEIGGQVDCEKGRVAPSEGRALFMQGARIGDAVFLKGEFHATGEVSLVGVEIGGHLECSGGRFETSKGVALNAQGARVTGVFFFQNVKLSNGFVDLTAAKVGTLSDDFGSWHKVGCVILDGFTYDRIGGAPTDSATRLQWLARGDQGVDHSGKEHFSPQPYTQLARVLRNMGHERAARDVLVARDRKIAAEEWTRARPKYGWSPVPHQAIAPLFWAFIAKLSHLLIDYGHRPLKALWSLLALWLIATTFAHFAWMQGDMVPNSDVILTSDNWAAVYEPDHPSVAWGKTPEGQSWETFNSLVWGLDLVVPILDLGQTQAWTPSTNLGLAGDVLWVAKPILIGFGWIVLAFAAAGVTGVARRQD